jgi:4-amino-4-deoxychorismate lyase
MSLLLESVKLLNGEYQNLFYHEQRMNHSLKLLFGEDQWFNLEDFMSHLKKPGSGLFKCRIVYDDQSKDVQFVPYEPKVIQRLQIVEDNDIIYEHKYVDRKRIDQLFMQKNICDDILIVKEGRVTDSSYSNIVFRRKNSWYTPWSALLKGTMRQNLLEWNDITEEDIFVDDIKDFDSFKLINAMLGFAGPEIDVSNIVY